MTAPLLAAVILGMVGGYDKTSGVWTHSEWKAALVGAFIIFLVFVLGLVARYLERKVRPPDRDQRPDR